MCFKKDGFRYCFLVWVEDSCIVVESVKRIRKIQEIHFPGKCTTPGRAADAIEDRNSEKHLLC